MVDSAVKVTTPELIAQVPSPATTKLPLVMQLLGVAGSTIQLAVKLADPVVASDEAPESMSVKVVVVAGNRVLVCGVAIGAAGAATTGMIVAMTFWPTTSATAYLIAGAVPEKVITGVKVTVLPLNVYVPTGLFRLSKTVTEVSVQLAATVSLLGHNPTTVKPVGSFVNGVIVCAVFHGPLFVSFTATGIGGGVTVGVYVVVEG
jgi:hypothetical protein